MGEFTKTIIVDGNTSAAIQAGISNLPVGQDGGTVIVESGTYTVTSTISIPSNTTLIGRGNVVLEINNIDISAFRNSNFSDGNTRIVISGFKIVVNIDTYKNHPVYLRNVSNCIIEKVYVTAVNSQGVAHKIDPTPNGTDGILIDANSDKCENNIIRQCAVVNFGKHDDTDNNDYFGNGIALSSVPETSKFCKQNSVINNYVNNALYGCYMVGAVESRVIGNVFINGKNFPRKEGQTIGDRSPGISARLCDNSQFVGNQTQGNTSHGIYLSDSSNCTVSGNVSSLNQQCGFKSNSGGETVIAKYNSIVGNICSQNESDISVGDKKGIFITGQGGGSSRYNTIMGNICWNNESTGIFEGTAGYVDHNSFAGNLCVFNRGADGNFYTIGTGTVKYNNRENNF